MGLLKNMIGNAIGNAISKEISKGIGNAVGKAIENAVAPTAERVVNKGAEAVNSAAQELDESLRQANAALEETAKASSEAGAEAKQTAGAAGGLASLESALAGWASRAESWATSMSASMKICPSCGQPSSADKSFCPSCGAKLPEKTLGEEYTCSKCGAANTPGTKFCSKCGTVLPAAEAEIMAQKEKDAKALDEMAATLPQFPRYSCGGKEFEFSDAGGQNGQPSYTLRFKACRQDVDAYVQLLTQAGFMKDASYDYWKVIDGVCRTCNVGDVQDGDACLYFYVSTIDKRNQPKAQEDPLKEIKGLFKKFLG